MNQERKIGQNEHYNAPERAYRRRTRRPAPEQKKGWFWQFSIGIFIISVLIWSWVKFTGPHYFPIRSVKIEGDYAKVDRNVLQQTILTYAQQGFWKIDATGLEDRLSQLPWIYSAKARRLWPDALVVTVTEQQPIANYGDGLLLNSNGDLFKVVQNTIPAGLPNFMGPQGQQKLMLMNFQQMTEIVAPLGIKITDLKLDPRQSWQLELSNGITLLLGRVDPLVRLQRFVAVYDQVIAAKAGNVNTVDLRYANGMAVSFKNKSAPT
jgi:cell division protein FtsQ